jgi:hypothetical protein
MRGWLARSGCWVPAGPPADAAPAHHRGQHRGRRAAGAPGGRARGGAAYYLLADVARLAKRDPRRGPARTGCVWSAATGSSGGGDAQRRQWTGARSAVGAGPSSGHLASPGRPPRSGLPRSSARRAGDASETREAGGPAGQTSRWRNRPVAATPRRSQFQPRDAPPGPPSSASPRPRRPHARPRVRDQTGLADPGLSAGAPASVPRRLRVRHARRTRVVPRRTGDQPRLGRDRRGLTVAFPM